MMMKWKIGILVGIILLAAGCLQANNGANTEKSIELEKDWMIDGYATAHHISQTDARIFFDQTYGLHGEKDIVQLLQQRTETFDADRQKMNGGNVGELGDIPAENYTQPDFYDTLETTGKNTWINAPAQLANTVGLFSVPAEQEATLESESTGFETYLFVGSGWGATYFQGVGFTARIEPDAPVALEIDPPHVLAGPTFPILDEEWVHRIRVKGRIIGEMEPGTYVITVKAALPPEEKMNEWARAHERYANMDSTLSDPRGLATLTLHVK